MNFPNATEFVEVEPTSPVTYENIDKSKEARDLRYRGSVQLTVKGE